MAKAWQKPMLISLVRANSNEAVLQNCKTVGAAGPTSMNVGCVLTPTTACGGINQATGTANAVVNCLDCSSLVNS